MADDDAKSDPSITAGTHSPEAAADAAAWERIDRALQSTRKWLWVFVVFGFLFSAAVGLFAIAVAVTWPGVDTPMRTMSDMSSLEIVFELSLLCILAVWAIASTVATLGLVQWARQRSTAADYRSLATWFDGQQLAWTAGVVFFGCGVAYFAIVLVMIGVS